MSADARAKAMAALAQFQLVDATVGDTLLRIAEITLEAIPSAAVAGITMLGEDGRPTTAIYTDDLSPEVDEAQYHEGRGPCLDAWRQKRVVRVADIEAVQAEYPAFAAACRQHDVLSTLSLPLIDEETALGALNLYARARDAFDADAEALADELAHAAGSVLANVAAYRSALALSEQLSHTMQSRAVIEQAKGILMARSPELSADAAFEMLRSASRRENVKLRDIAQRIIDRRHRPRPEGEGRHS